MASSANPHLLNLSNNEVIPITEKFSVGRSLKADYVLSNPAISRIHFTVEKRSDSWTIRDQSTNGTSVNNTIIKSTWKSLNSGDLIQVVEGSITFRFENPSNSVLARDTFPSVANDHSYDRREDIVPEPSIIVDLTTLDSPPSTSSAPKRTSSTECLELPFKKNKSCDETSDDMTVQCFLEPAELECSICQELFIKAVTLNCAHSFCSSCIHKWKNQRNHCPICRRSIESINPSMLLDNFVKKLVAVMDEESRQQREKVVKERPEQIPVPGPAGQVGPASLPELTESDFDEEEDEYYTEDDEDDNDEVMNWVGWGEILDFTDHFYY